MTLNWKDLYEKGYRISRWYKAVGKGESSWDHLLCMKNPNGKMILMWWIGGQTSHGKFFDDKDEANSAFKSLLMGAEGRTISLKTRDEIVATLELINIDSSFAE